MTSKPISTPTRPPTGFVLFGAFLVFAAAMASLAAITLLWPGTPLDRAWKLNPRAYGELTPFARLAGIGFTILAVMIVAITFGWFTRKLWAWWLAVLGLAVQVLANIINLFTGRLIEGVVGVIVAGAFLVYLLQRNLRLTFLPRS